MEQIATLGVVGAVGLFAAAVTALSMRAGQVSKVAPARAKPFARRPGDAVPCDLFRR